MVGILLPSQQLAVGNGLHAGRHRDDHLRRLPLVGLVDTGEPVAIAGRLSLAPDLERRLGVGGAGAIEMESVLGFMDAVIDLEGALLTGWPA